MKKIRTLIEVTRFGHGDPLYIVEAQALCMDPTTKDASLAKDYTDQEVELQYDLGMLILDTDETFPRSGLRVDTIAVVKVAVITEVVEIERHVGRPPAA